MAFFRKKAHHQEDPGSPSEARVEDLVTGGPGEVPWDGGALEAAGPDDPYSDEPFFGGQPVVEEVAEKAAQAPVLEEPARSDDIPGQASPADWVSEFLGLARQAEESGAEEVLSILPGAKGRVVDLASQSEAEAEIAADVAPVADAMPEPEPEPDLVAEPAPEPEAFAEPSDDDRLDEHIRQTDPVRNEFSLSALSVNSFTGTASSPLASVLQGGFAAEYGFGTPAQTVPVVTQPAAKEPAAKEPVVSESIRDEVAAEEVFEPFAEPEPVDRHSTMETPQAAQDVASVVDILPDIADTFGSVFEPDDLEIPDEFQISPEIQHLPVAEYLEAEDAFFEPDAIEEQEEPIESESFFEPETLFEPEAPVEQEAVFEPESIFEPEATFEPEPFFEPEEPELETSFFESDEPSETEESADLTASDTPTFFYNVAAHFAAPADGAPLTWAIAGPDWIEIDADGNLGGEPSVCDVGDVSVTVTATDSTGQNVDMTFVLTIGDIGDAPAEDLEMDLDLEIETAPLPEQVADLEPQSDDGFTYDVSGHFAGVYSGDGLTFETSGPAWLSVDAAGTLRGTPGGDDIGEVAVAVTAADSDGNGASVTFGLTIVSEGGTPIVVGIVVQTPSTSGAESAPVATDSAATALDADADENMNDDFLTAMAKFISSEPDVEVAQPVAPVSEAPALEGAPVQSPRARLFDNLEDIPEPADLESTFADEAEEPEEAWTIILDTEEVWGDVAEPGAKPGAEPGTDEAGTVTLSDGTEIDFSQLERIEWGTGG